MRKMIRMRKLFEEGNKENDKNEEGIEEDDKDE